MLKLELFDWSVVFINCFMFCLLFSMPFLLFRFCDLWNWFNVFNNLPLFSAKCIDFALFFDFIDPGELLLIQSIYLLNSLLFFTEEILYWICCSFVIWS